MNLSNLFRVNSIFIRVYLHMLLSMLLVIILAVGATSLINHVRVEQYREQLASGTFYLLSRGWQQQSTEKRASWLIETGELLDIELNTTTLASSGLDHWQLRRLSENRTLLLNGRTTDELMIYRYLSPEEGVLVQAYIPRLSEQHARASVQLLLQTVQNSSQPPEQVLAELGLNFSYPIKIVAFDQIRLERTQKQQLANNETILVFIESGRSVIAYTRLDENRLLQVGPVNLFDPYPLVLMAAIALIALLLSGSGIYFSLRILEHRLQKVEQAASRIAAGHLSTRVRVEGDDFVVRLAKAFNSMAKQVQELLRTQQEMIHAVSHELRTPVARIRFGMQMIEDLVEDPFVHKQLKGIDADIQELDGLVDEILTYARLGQEGLSLNYESCHVLPLVQEVLDGLQVLKPNLKLQVRHLNPYEGDHAEVEIRYFQRAVQNLVSNACRYASGQVMVSCYMEADSLRIDVEDDGPGIPEEDWERVFTPFSRLDDSRTRASGGYGLGLSIVHRIMYWHQGSAIVSRSDDLGGASFSLVFPRFHTEVAY
ncbi:two-component system, OmpR family, sensor histidine kinase RstB [Oceanospirillum multiglobuliferum]|nr:ATP-binding protein [Oceanospirillum multiglobuliferum]SKA01668.1 two-component system, OmpR family, sensor histidine kinase RstB [Oceanospirillum multiglobuliferum]